MEEQAKTIAEEYMHSIEKMYSIAQTISKKPTLYWEWWPNPIFTPGKINWLTEISALAGGINLFQDVELASVQTDWTDVVERKPDYIMMAWVGVAFERIQPANLLKRPYAKELHAVQLEQLHVMEEWLYCRPSPRLIEGAIKLAKILHPKQYEEIKSPSFYDKTTSPLLGMWFCSSKLYKFHHMIFFLPRRTMLNASSKRSFASTTYSKSVTFSPFTLIAPFDTSSRA